MTQTARAGARAEKTRAAILEAAEDLFSARGFAATRLEDVAERVGIRRASIVYHFRDKQVLYDAVIDDVFGALLAAIATALGGPASLAERIEAGVGAWVDFVGARPSFARLLLREVADATAEQRPALLRNTQPFVDLIRREVFERAGAESASLTPVDPVHLASTIAGATVFYVAAMPTLVPDRGAALLTPDQLAAHRAEVLLIVRRLLGTRGPRLARP